jgi:hypothetical protein
MEITLNQPATADPSTMCRSQDTCIFPIIGYAVALKGADRRAAGGGADQGATGGGADQGVAGVRIEMRDR